RARLAALGGRPEARDEPRLAAGRFPGAPHDRCPALLREAAALRRRLRDLGDAPDVGFLTAGRPAGTLLLGAARVAATAPATGHSARAVPSERSGGTTIVTKRVMVFLQ